MIIKRLTLHNFGVYAGTNTFVFSNTKPVVLIGGMNGRGKTTFLNAVLIAMYGSNSFAYRDSDINTYGQYLRSFVNESDKSLESFVEIEFEIDATDDNIYTVLRKWNSNKARTKETIEVRKNGKKDDFLSENWLIFIENLLPSALSPYFFFDGDNIADLAVGSTDEKMKESIKALLGITILDQLEKDLKRISTNSLKKKETAINEDKITFLRDKAQNIQEELEAIDISVEEKKELIEEITRKIEKKKSDYIAKGGMIVEQRQELFQKRAEMKAELQHLRSAEIDISASELPLCLVKDLVENIHNKAQRQNEYKELRIAAEKIKELQAGFSHKDSSDIKEFISYIDGIASSHTDESTITYSADFLFRTNDLLNQNLNSKISQLREIRNKVEKLTKAVNEIDEHLSMDIDEQEVSVIFRTIKKMEQEKIEVEAQISRLLRQRSEVNGRFIRASSEYSQFVEASLSNLEMNNEIEREQKYNQYAQIIIKKYRTSLQKRKINQLTKTITSSFKQLADKQNLINEIVMDPETLEFSYLDFNGNIVPKGSLSEGEKQMMIISILWALARCSKRKLPVIIDTPLARLDSSHRKAMVKTYFPNASDQTIILSTDSEIIGEYYDLLKANVSDEFKLVYDDNTNSSHIEKGYFGE